MKEAYNIFQTLFHNRDPNTINNEIQECKKYIEENKQFSRLGRNKRRNVVDTISDIIKQYNIKTNAEWNIHVDTETKHQLMREYGLSVDNYVQRLIRANKHKNLKYYKYVPTAELLLNELHNYMDNHETIEDNFHAICDWLNYLCTENGIDLPEFLAWNACIKDMRYTKINTLVLQGPTNAGKSLIADALVSICQPEEITREKDNSGFHLDQLPEASAVIFEEPCITPVNVGTWKLLFEGKQIKTDIKHKDKEGIRRLPIWITTATKVTANIDSYEACQVNQRLKIFQFHNSIHHRTDYTKTYCKTNKTLNKPPGHVKAVHFAYLFLQHWNHIKKIIEDLDKELTLNPNRLDVTCYPSKSSEGNTTYDALNQFQQPFQEEEWEATPPQEDQTQYSQMLEKDGDQISHQ